MPRYALRIIVLTLAGMYFVMELLLTPLAMAPGGVPDAMWDQTRYLFGFQMTDVLAVDHLWFSVRYLAQALVSYLLVGGVVVACLPSRRMPATAKVGEVTTTPDPAFDERIDERPEDEWRTWLAEGASQSA